MIQDIIMLYFPNCKINIGLDILRKRPDGYHDINTLMYPVADLYDGLEIIPFPGHEAILTCSGIPTDCPMEKNLVIKAWHAVDELYHIGGVKIHLHKNIPSGAGLGGGSSDAAFTIIALNEIFDLRMTTAQAEEIAGKLGSDVPFFIRNKPAFCSGRGEIMEPADIDLSDKKIVIIKPDSNVSTAEAYSKCNPHIPDTPLKDRLHAPIESWQQTVINDFEKSVFSKHPEIKALKQHFIDEGAIYASMSGSGSAVYGIFKKGTEVNTI